MGKVKIGDLFTLEKGSLQSTKCIPGEFTFITASSDWKTHKEYTHDCEALVYAVAASGSLGRCHYFKGKFISSDLCFILKEKDKNKYPINYQFYQNVFNFFKDTIVSRTKAGTSKESISQKRFSEYKLPYFDILFQTAWEKKLNIFNEEICLLNKEINTQSDILAKLKQSVLQEAIEGKLTADWRKAHPVRKGDGEYDGAALLETIKKFWGKNNFNRKSIRIRQNIELSQITNSWVKTNINSIAITKVGGTPSRSVEEYWNGETLWVSSGEVANCDICSTKERITKAGVENSAAKILPAGTVLIAMIGQGKTRGQTAILKVEAATNQNVCGILIDHNFVNSNFLFYYFLSRYEESRSFAAGGSQPALSGEKIGKFKINLPPLAEQRAIVERVEGLLTMVDELEAQAGERRGQAEGLVQAVLGEAF